MPSLESGGTLHIQGAGGVACQAHGCPQVVWRGPRELCSVVSEETAPMLPPPVEPWAVPLLTQDMSSRGHGKSISATGAHVLSLLRVQMALPWGVRLFAAPLSQGRPQEMYLICALSHQSWLLTTLLQELAPGPRASIRISPGRFDLHTLTYDSLPGCHLLHLPSAILSPGSERCPCCL